MAQAQSPDLRHTTGLVRAAGAILIGTIAALLALVVVALVALQLPVLRQALLGYALDAINQGGTRVEIAGIGGTWPQRLELRGLTVSDAQGVWLSLDAAELEWRPAALLTGTLHIDHVSATALGISRTPAGEASTSSSGGFGLPVLPFALRIDEAKVTRLTLGNRLTGVAEKGMLAQLDATARLGLSASRLDLALAARRTDKVPGRIDARVLYDRRGEGLDVTISGEDGAARNPGLVATLGHVAGAERVTFEAQARNDGGRIAASANLDAGKALTFAAEAQGNWNGTLALSTRLGAEGNLVATTLADLGAPRRVDLASDIGLDGNDTLTLDNVRLDAGAFALTGDARLSNALSSAAHDLTAQGKLAGLDRFLDKPGNAALASLDWRLATRLDTASGQAQIAEAIVTVPSATVRFAGSAALDGSAVKGGAEADISDLSPLGEFVGRKLGGSAHVALTPVALEPGGDTAGDIVIETKDVDFGDATLNRLAGGNLAADGSFILPKEGGFAVPAFTVTPNSGAYRFRASIAANARDMLSGEVHFEAAELATLLPDQGMAGKLNADATLAGSLSAPGGVLKAQLTNGTLAGMPTKLAALDLTAEQGGAGPLAFRFDGTDGKAALDATLVLPKDGGARLDALKADLFGAVLDGAIAVSDEGLVSGGLKGNGVPLKPFGMLAGLPLDGSGDLALDATPRNGKQDASLSLAMNRLVVHAAGGVTLERATLDATANDLFGEMTVDGTFVSPAGQAGITRLTSVRATAKGPLSKLALATDVAGTRESLKLEPLSLSAAAVYADKSATLSLSRLDFSIGPASTKLAAPATVALGSGVDIKALSLDMKGPSGSGSLKTGLDLRPRTVRLDLDAENLPLELVAPFLLSGEAHGTAGAKVSLDSGRGTGSLALKLSKLTLSQADETERPAFDADLNGRWAKGRLDLEATAIGVSTRPFELRASLPVIRDTQGAWPMLAKRGAVSGSLAWDGPVASLVALADLSNQQLSGEAKVALSISGDISGPVVNGETTIENGAYENFDSGTVLRNLSLSLKGRSSQALDFALTANDSGNGRISANGEVHLAKDTFPAISANARFANARLVQRAEADIGVDGTLELSGAAFPPGPDAPLMLKGDLTTTLAQIRIPEQLSGSVAQIEVVEVNGAPSRSAAPQASAPLPIQLDVAFKTGAPVRVSGRGLDTLWTGELAIGGTVANPGVVGTLTKQRGTLDFAGKTFNLTKGNVRFLDRTSIDPDLDIALTYTRTDLTATIAVTGRSSAPVIALSSDPDLPRDEILSRILFNKGAGELSAMEAVQLANTLAQLSGKGGVSGAGILNSVQETLGLDVLRIDQGQSGATTVSAGKYIQKGVYVGVEQGALASDSSVKVEIEVTPQISVDTRIGQNAGGDVGVNWKWDY